MAGWLTNNMFSVGPIIVNGTTVAVTDIVNNGTVVGEQGPTPVYTQLTGYEQLAVDTEVSGGSIPQTVAASAFDVAAVYFALANSAATATAGAATLNTVAGTITSEALTTAAGATYTLTITNSAVTAASNVQAAAFLKSATTGGPLQVVSTQTAAGSVVIVVKNTGSAVLNGTIAVLFQVGAAK